MAINAHWGTLERLSIFCGAEAGLSAELVFQLCPQVLNPGDCICAEGDIDKQIYITMKGKLVVLLDDGATPRDLLTAGCWFGESSILNAQECEMGNRWAANVSYSSQSHLRKEGPLEAVTEYPRAPNQERVAGCSSSGRHRGHECGPVAGPIRPQPGDTELTCLSSSG